MIILFKAGTLRSEHNRHEFCSAKILTLIQKETLLYFQVWSTSSLPNKRLNGIRSGKQWFYWLEIEIRGLEVAIRIVPNSRDAPSRPNLLAATLCK